MSKWKTQDIAMTNPSLWENPAEGAIFLHCRLSSPYSRCDTTRRHNVLDCGVTHVFFHWYFERFVDLLQEVLSSGHIFENRQVILFIQKPNIVVGCFP